MTEQLVHAQMLQSCSTLCTAVDCSPRAPLSMGILQAEIPGWVASSSSSGSSQPRNESSISCVSCTVGGFFTTHPRKPLPLLQKSRSHSFYLSPTIFTVLIQFYFPVLLLFFGYVNSASQAALRTEHCTEQKWKSFSPVGHFATPWTMHSMELSRPVYWSG